MDRDEEFEGIVAALAILLDELEAKQSPAAHFDQSRPLSASEAVGGMARTEAGAAAARLIQDPVGNACRIAVEELGCRLAEIGGLGAMGRALDAVGKLDPDKADWRDSVLDKRWNGIGGWAS